jgi:hypothetical protein
VIEDDLLPALKALADASGCVRAGRLGLWLSREGRWFFDGQAVEHERLSALLDRSMMRRGEALIVTTGMDVLAFDAEDAPLRVVAFDAGLGQLHFHTGGHEPMPLQVVVDDDGVVRSATTLGMWARWERRVAHQLASMVDEQGVVGGLAWGAQLVAADPVTDWTSAPRRA